MYLLCIFFPWHEEKNNNNNNHDNVNMGQQAKEIGEKQHEKMRWNEQEGGVREREREVQNNEIDYEK